MYANWFKAAAEVNAYLSTNYRAHREETEKFATALADTSPMNMGKPPGPTVIVIIEPSLA